jgi:hypothetical protein
VDTTKVGAEKIAATMLAQYGIKFIWDTNVAAAAAYGLGNNALAADLIEIAEAAEEVWLHSEEVG